MIWCAGLVRAEVVLTKDEILDWADAPNVDVPIGVEFGLRLRISVGISGMCFRI